MKSPYRYADSPQGDFMVVEDLVEPGAVLVVAHCRYEHRAKQIVDALNNCDEPVPNDAIDEPAQS